MTTPSINKVAKTYPVYYDTSLVHGKLNPAQASRLRESQVKYMDEALDNDFGDFPVAVEAGREIPARPEKIVSEWPEVVPETKRRMLGLLPPKIPVRYPTRMTGLHQTAFPDADQMHLRTFGVLSPALVEKLTKAALPIHDRMVSQMKPGTIQIQQKSASSISFAWAKSGSWDEYDQEMGRVLKQALVGGGPAAAAAIGGPAAAATAPPPPAPGLMDNITGTLSKGWNSMPTWGQGALIGGGIGALGGMLSDKKKMRGALQGALLGGGLGAAGGYAYSQMNPSTSTGNVDAAPKPPATTTPPSPPAKGFWDNATEKALSAGDAATGGSAVGSAALIGAGSVAKRLGNSKVQVAGAPGSSSDASADARMVRPTRAQAMKALQLDHNGRLGTATSQLASANPPPRIIGAGGGYLPTPDQTAANARLINQPGAGNLLNRNMPINMAAGNEALPTTANKLIDQYMKQLEVEAGRKLAPNWQGKPLNTALKAVGTGSQILGALGLANKAVNAFGSGAAGPTSIANRIGMQPPTETGLSHLVNTAKGYKAPDVIEYMNQAGFSPELQARALNLLGLK